MRNCTTHMDVYFKLKCKKNPKTQKHGVRHQAKNNFNLTTVPSLKKSSENSNFILI